jgi:hypothetical protein
MSAVEREEGDRRIWWRWRIEATGQSERGGERRCEAVTVDHAATCNGADSASSGERLFRAETVAERKKHEDECRTKVVGPFECPVDQTPGCKYFRFFSVSYIFQ